MPWGLWSSSTPSSARDDSEDSEAGRAKARLNDKPTTSTPPPSRTEGFWLDSLTGGIQGHFREPQNWIAPVAAAGLTFGLWTFYHTYLRRFSDSHNIAPGVFRRRSILGKVTSVGDGDGFHMFHTPGGRLAGWGWLRRVPREKKDLKGRTISVRIAGIDAPEGAHFGRPAQPFASEARAWLETYICNRRVRAFIYKRDQYERVVATVFVRRPPFFLRRDVGLEMLKHGLAATYEAKTGAEFGGLNMEMLYKAAEGVARGKGKGLWSVEKVGFFGSRQKKQELETPMAYKKRMKLLDEQKQNV